MGRLNLLLSRVGARRANLKGVFPLLGKLVDRSDPMFPEYPLVVVERGRVFDDWILTFLFRGFLSSVAERDERLRDLDFEEVSAEFPVHEESVYVFRFAGSLLGVVTDE